MPHFLVADGETTEAPIIGSAMRGHTDGFIQFGLWIRLGVAALEDLFRTI